MRGGLTRVTLTEEGNSFGIWTPDGTRIIFSSTRDGSQNLYWRAADGTGTVERLTESSNTQWPNSISPDGSRLVFRETGSDAGSDLHVLTLDDERRVEPLIAAEFNERMGKSRLMAGRWHMSLMRRGEARSMCSRFPMSTRGGGQFPGPAVSGRSGGRRDASSSI